MRIDTKMKFRDGLTGSGASNINLISEIII